MSHETGQKEKDLNVVFAFCNNLFRGTPCTSTERDVLSSARDGLSTERDDLPLLVLEMVTGSRSTF